MRYSILDGFRGYFLIMMMLVHMDDILHAYVRHLNHHPLGFVEDAQGFVFLSGLVIGMVYGRILLKKSAREMTRAVLKRMATIYAYNTGLVLVATGLALWFVARGPLPPILATFGDRPLVEGLTSLLLLNGPNYLDILPMYIVFMAVTPFALIAIQRGYHVAVILASVAVWLIAQSDMQAVVLGQLDRATGLTAHGGIGFGLYFNRFAWQVIYILGLVAGMFWAQGRLDLAVLERREMKPVFAVALAVALGLFVLRRVTLAFGDSLPPAAAAYLAQATERSYMPVLLLANFLADLFIVAWLIVAGPKSRFAPVRAIAVVLRAVFTWKPFVFLGQHSLQVYSFHVLVIYLTYSFFDFSALPRLPREGLAVAFALSLYLPAFVHALYQKSRTQPAAAEARPSAPHAQS